MNVLCNIGKIIFYVHKIDVIIIFDTTKNRPLVIYNVKYVFVFFF